MTEIPLVTVGITAFGEGEYLQQALDSVTSQSTSRWNAILILDGGSDKITEEIFSQIQHPALKKIKLDKNRGPYYTRSLALENTETDWYCHLDADDCLPENAVEIITKTAEEYSEIEYMRGKSLYFDNHHFQVRENKVIDEEKLSFTLPITGTSPIKKKLFTHLGGYCKELYKGGADWDFWISVIESGAKGKFIDSILYERRLRKNSVGDNWVMRRHEVAKKIITNHPLFFHSEERINNCLSKSYELAAREHRRTGNRKLAAKLSENAIKYGNENPTLHTILKERTMPYWRYKLRQIRKKIW
jgi:glycosyltransferase involved in cell wall biosynthesis